MFVLQGNQMNRAIKIFRLDEEIPSASMSFFNTGTIIILIPVYDLLILPALKKQFGFVPTSLQRTGAGYILAILSMISAFLIEMKRLDAADEGKIEVRIEDDEEVEVVDLSIWWQIFPYALVGASEVMSSIGLMEFFYAEVRERTEKTDR